MDNQAIIVAVSLYGSSADQQPDPIVLRPEDESWSHFSTLMMSLYKSLPSAVNIKYLDDEGDWIDMGSEAEFSEAVRMTRTSGEILQVRVLPVRADGWEDHTYVIDTPQASLGSNKDPYKWIPTTDLRYECEEPLVYPHPPVPTASQGVMITSVDGTQYMDASATQPWLVYPHPTEQPQTQAQPQPHESLGENPSCTAGQVLSSDTSCLEPQKQQLPNPNSTSKGDRAALQSGSKPTTPAQGNKTTLLAAATAWQEAAKLPPEEKVKFLKGIVSGCDTQYKNSFNKTSEKSHEVKKSDSDEGQDNEYNIVIDDSLLEEILCDSIAALQPNGDVWDGQNVQLTPQGQDPFEVDTANVMDHAQLLSEMDNSPTLTPTRISAVTDNTADSRQAEEQSPSAFKFAGLSPLAIVPASTVQPPTSSSRCTTVKMAYEGQNTSASTSALSADSKQSCKKKGISRLTKGAVEDVKSKNAKSTVKPPVPLPRALLMMEGAPCGANAVAIEMPVEAESSKVEPAGESEVAASGGAASVAAASEETGEVVARESDAAAVSSQMKQVEERECGAGAVVSWETTPILQVEVQSHKHRKDKSPERKKKVKDGKSERKSLKKRADGDRDKERKEDKEDKDKRREDRHKRREEKKMEEKEEKRKEEREKVKKKHTKEESRMKLSEDVESGEKVGVKGDAALQYNDFAKYMKKLKKEMQASIVRDVTQETYRIVQTGLFSLSQTDMNPTPKEIFSDSVEHAGIYCDHCNSSIVGIRYKCGNCLDFDLCERCEGQPGLHDPTHVFLKLRQPARNAGYAPSSAAGDRYCLLRENIYHVESGAVASSAGDLGSPVDLSIHSAGEDQGVRVDKADEEKPVIPKAVQKKEAKQENPRRVNEGHLREYEDLLSRLYRACEIQDTVRRDRQLYGHLGGCSETLNSSSFDLTMARGIDSGMGRIGQEAEERLVAHTGPLPSAPPRQRFRGQDTTPERSSNDCCGYSSSGGSSSIIQLPTPPDTAITSALPSLEICSVSSLAVLAELGKLEDPLKTDDGQMAPQTDHVETVQPVPELTPLNLIKAPSLSANPPPPESTATVPLMEASLPNSAPVAPTPTAPPPPLEPVTMTPLMAQSLPQSVALIPLDPATPIEGTQLAPAAEASLPQATKLLHLPAESLPDTTPLTSLVAASSLPKPTPAAADESLPESTPLVPLVAANPVALTPSPHATQSTSFTPLQAATPATAMEETNTGKHEEVEQDCVQDETILASARRDSNGSDDFVHEDVSSSSDDDNDKEDEDSDLHMTWDSDSSDDFCIIDPESAALMPEGFELLPDSTSLVAALTQSQTVTCDDPLPTSCPAPSYEEVMSGSQRFCSAEVEEQSAVVTETAATTDVEEATSVKVETTSTSEAASVRNEEMVSGSEKAAPVTASETVSVTLASSGVATDVASANAAGTGSEEIAAAPTTECAAAKDEDTQEKTTVEGLSTDVSSGLIHNISEEERNILLELLRNEMGREFILEARRAEAEFRNRELELMGEQVERRCEGARKEEEHSSSTASLAGSARSRSLSRSTSEASSVGAVASTPAGEREMRVSRSSSVASSYTKDADCQTVPNEPGFTVGHEQPFAGHIIQNVATGVSKAATTAFHTAKDVFHALQAKQSEWKTPSSSYKPPQSQWKPKPDTYKPPVNTYKPPEDTYKPPQNTYKPPQDTYQPPRDYDDYSDYVPPSSNWTPPRSLFVPPNIEWIVGGSERGEASSRGQGRIAEVPAGSVDVAGGEEMVVSEVRRVQEVPVDDNQTAAQTTTTTTTTESSSVDEGLEMDRLQREGMVKLVEMGFANREENRRLLTQFKGDLQKVIQALLEGQASDRWAQNRH